jgi:hypothetical protein
VASRSLAWQLGVALLFFTVGCSPSASPASKPTAWPPAGAQVLAGGCGKTDVLTRAAPPPWALAGFRGDIAVPWALSESGKSVAYLFARQLVAGGVRGDGSANKILWVIKDVGIPHISAHLAGATAPTIDIGGQGTNGNQLPTIVDLPAPGCWSFDLSWSAISDHISLQVLPRGSLPT